MKKYDSYKDSGIEWIGEIPSHWKKIKFSYITNLMTCGHASTPEYVEEGGIPFLSAQNIKNEKLDLTVLKQVPISLHESLIKNKKVEKGDLLQVRVGGADTIGQTAIVDLDFDFSIYVSLAHIKLNKLALNGYVKHLCNSLEFKEFCGVLMKKGAGVANLNVSDVASMLIPLPSLNEQISIANYLDQKTNQIDDLIAKKERLIQLLEEERTAIINELVTGKKVWNGYAWTEPVEVKDSGIEWLGEIPAHWEVKKLKYFANVILGKMLTNEDKGGYQLKPYLRAKNIEWIKPNVDDVKEMWFSENEISQYRIKENDLLVSEGGEVGRTCIWQNQLEECYIQNSVHKVTILDGDSNYFLSQFVLFGNYGHFDAIVNKISIAHLTKEKLKDVVFIVPPIDEQLKISKYITSKVTEIENIVSKTIQEIELLKEYKTALISEVVSGKVDVRDEVLN